MRSKNSRRRHMIAMCGLRYIEVDQRRVSDVQHREVDDDHVVRRRPGTAVACAVLGLQAPHEAESDVGQSASRSAPELRHRRRPSRCGERCRSLPDRLHLREVVRASHGLTVIGPGRRAVDVPALRRPGPRSSTRYSIASSSPRTSSRDASPSLGGPHRRRLRRASILLLIGVCRAPTSSWPTSPRAMPGSVEVDFMAVSTLRARRPGPAASSGS